MELNGAPEGIAIQDVEAVSGGVAIVLRADGKAKAGMRGNLIVDAYVGRRLLGTLPAIAFWVI